MSEFFPEVECPICYCDVNDDDIKILHTNESNLSHSVCQDCHQTLREQYILKCPLCREPINSDLEYHHEKIISDIQLRSFNLSEEFIAHIKETRPGLLPFKYYNSTDGVNLIRNLKQDYQSYIENT